MKKLLFLLIGIMLLSCNANNSNVAKVENVADTTQVDSAKVDSVEVDTMTTEEVTVAAKVGAVRAYKMAPDTFKVIKLVPTERLSLADYIADVDSLLMVGVVSATGKYYVPAEYSDVNQLDRDIFIGTVGISNYTPRLDIPDNYELYQVVYRGKKVGGLSALKDVKPLYHHGKVAGFIKTLYIEEADTKYIFYIDTKGKGWDVLWDIRGASYPKFERYKVQGDVLTLWGGAKTPEELQAFWPEDRSLYRVNLVTGAVLENPFVPTEADE